MKDYILFMHRDAPDQDAAQDAGRWAFYIAWLQGTGQFDGGSSIGSGERMKKGQPGASVNDTLSGFIRIRATDIDAAKALLVGNPVHEAGGTVDIRELPRS